jgi:hypothetical protein
MLGHLRELQATPEKEKAALQAYDQAIGILKGETSPTPELTQSLAVAWMNRANILQRFGVPEALQHSVKAYDEALSLASVFSPTDHAGLVGSMWMNRGAALERVLARELDDQAAASFRSAIGVLEASGAGAENVHIRRLTLAARINHAGVVLRLGGAAAASDTIAACGVMLDSLKDLEDNDPADADLAFRARRIVCEASGRLMEGLTGANVDRDVLSRATDSAEEALSQAKLWESRGLPAFRPWTRWFFDFALSLYAQFQPQFLGEFILDTLRSPQTPPAWSQSPELRTAALTTTERVRRYVGERLLQSVADPAAPQLNELLQTLQDVEKQLTNTTVTTA